MCQFGLDFSPDLVRIISRPDLVSFDLVVELELDLVYTWLNLG